jgi:hypothetical protein
MKPAQSAPALLLLAAVCWLATGCAPWNREPPRPGATAIGAKPVIVPAQLRGNLLIVEAKWDSYGPYHFLIDTGSSATLLTPDLATRYAARGYPPPAVPEVRVKSAAGATTVLPATTVERLQLGSVLFEAVPVLIYDCADLSAQLGVKIDGILGFPLFRETVLTLDYPNHRVILRAGRPAVPLPGETIAFNNQNRIPLIPVRLGDRPCTALIDSGQDAALSLNPARLKPKFAFGPTDGPTVGTLTGDRQLEVGRLGEDLAIGGYVVPRPVAELTDGLSTLGGGILKQFTLTFDQEHNDVTFWRDSFDPIAIPSMRSAGLSFRKTPAYWRVVGVIAGSPAAAASIEPGDLVVRVNGEAVAGWDLRRYDELIATAASVEYTFLNGSTETNRRLGIADVVP